MVHQPSELRGKINHLPEGIVDHIEEVADIAMELARRFGIDEGKVWTAAFLHDVARVTQGEELIRQAQEFGLRAGPLEEAMPVFLHGPVGAEIVNREMGIQDEEVLEAVRCHTIGRWGLGPVGRVVFLADKLDPSKEGRYPFMARVRELASVDLDRAILEFINGDVSGHLAGGRYVHPCTIDFRNYLLAKERWIRR